jgi:ribosomal protein L7Ae-like RNA K-turn-binding protein
MPELQEAAREALLGLIGLGVRGGLALPGVDVTCAWVRQGKCQVVIVASDASRRAKHKAVDPAVRAGVPVVTGPSAETLGTRLGRPPVMVIGVRDRSLAAGIIAAAARGTD